MHISAEQISKLMPEYTTRMEKEAGAGEAIRKFFNVYRSPILQSVGLKRKSNIMTQPAAAAATPQTRPTISRQEIRRRIVEASRRARSQTLAQVQRQRPAAAPHQQAAAVQESVPGWVYPAGGAVAGAGVGALTGRREDRLQDMATYGLLGGAAGGGLGWLTGAIGK